MPKAKAKETKQKHKPKTVAKVRSVRKPVSTGVTISGTRPVFSGGVDRMSVSHRELLGSVSSAAVESEWAKLDEWDINPGDVWTFPWLSTIAWSWESYTFRSLRFQYVPRCSTAQVGAVQLFCDYDFADEAPAEEGLASSFQGFVESPPYQKTTMTCNKESMLQGKKWKYVVPSTGLPASADPTNYYGGTFYAYSVGVETGTPMGSIWVEYTVDFMIPTLGAGPSAYLGNTASVIVGDTTDLPVFSTVVTTGTGTLHDNAAVMGSLDNIDLPLGASASYNSTTGEITIRGPGVYSFTLAGLWDKTGGGDFHWTSLPSMEDIVNVASTGLEWLSDATLNSYAAYGGRTQFGATFAVTGAVGILRLVSGTVGWPWSVTGISPAASIHRWYNNFLLSFITGSGGPFLAAKRKKRDTVKETVETKEARLTPEDALLLSRIKKSYALHSSSISSSVDKSAIIGAGGAPSREKG